MKTLFPILVVILSLQTIPATSQIAIIDYMYVDPNSSDEYLELEKTWKKVHQERVKVGLITGWYLYNIRYTGTESPYQYATITYYKTFDDSENLFFEGIFDNALGTMDQDSFFVYTEEVRDLVRSEVFVQADGLEYNYQDPAKYIYLNFIKVNPGQENNYVEIEKYVWKPIHESLQRDNKMANWSLWNLWFYTHSDYNYITMNEFYEYKDIDSYNYSETFEIVHKGKDLESMMRNTSDARTSYKAELWELVDFVVTDN